MSRAFAFCETGVIVPTCPVGLDGARILTKATAAESEDMVTIGNIRELEYSAEIARRQLETDQCVLVVVDIQERLLPPIFEKERLVRNSQLLIRLARILNVPVVATTQYTKGLGSIVPEIASLLPQAEAIDKLEFSCFGSDSFCSQLKRLPGNRNTVLLCGMESHICVTQTALGALREGYLVHVASDAVSSRTEWNWKMGLERMRAAGTIISSTEMMIYELLRRSGGDAFKELLPYLKG
ncbi:MAG TPA: hydrolase [Terriglobales bacterium]|nr:hydrolase [Terriglobales bacterium]